MSAHYNSEKSILLLIALLKEYGIKKIIASPGNTNITFIGSVQSDPFFEIYSCVDERSAAYMACGLAEASGEPVCISCTGATASRNYMPGLTEAYYRKLPVIAITSSQCIGRVDNLVSQVLDRSSIPNDLVKISVSLPIVHSSEEEWECTNKINKALIECKREGGGPVHINLQTLYTQDFSITTLPKVNKIDVYKKEDDFPKLDNGKVAIFIASHKTFDKETELAIEEFCEKYDSVVFCDHTSGYYGKYKVLYEIVAFQESIKKEKPNVIIHLGEVSGAYGGMWQGNEIWRVSNDGKVKDPFKLLTKLFDMNEVSFFKKYCELRDEKSTCNYYEECKLYTNYLRENIPNLPFSNFWVAKETAPRIPKDSYMHFAILNSLRAWNFFELNDGIKTSSNVGGFGIDGPISTLVGASFAAPNKLHFLVVGDLAFFYDLNVLGNRHIKNNVRILLVNNCAGTQFTMYDSYGKIMLGEDVYQYVAAEGHNGKKSPVLVKSFVENLGFDYRSASSKEEFDAVIDWFVNPKAEKSLILEVFTNPDDESDAAKKMLNIDVDLSFVMKDKTKDAIKRVLGDSLVSKLKRGL